MHRQQVVEANVILQKLNSSIDDLALIERANRLETIFGYMSNEAKEEVLRFARDMAAKGKSSQIRDLRSACLDKGVELEIGYIDQRLEQCRSAHGLGGLTLQAGGGGGGSGMPGTFTISYGAGGAADNVVKFGGA